MTERFNKNGIRILDPPGRNGMRKSRKCLPGEHRFREKPERETISSFTGEPLITYECVLCGETDTRIWGESV